jgi:anti-anti-sigma factor
VFVHSEEFVMSNVIDSMDRFGALEVCGERNGERYVITLTGELDLAGVDRVTQELLQAEATDVSEVVLDLEELTFIDSSGIAVILAADARSRADGERLRLNGGSAHVRRVFELSGLTDRLPFAG